MTSSQNLPKDAQNPLICLLSADLMMSSRIASVCRQHDCRWRMVRSLDDGWTPDEAAATMLVIDLQSPNWSASAFAQLGPERRPAAVVAYAQHVEGELLEKAKQAEIEHVVTRGQFDAQVDRWITQFLANRADATH